MQIEVLPELPAALKFLYCYETQIKELPELPTTLTELCCPNTKIKELPVLPTSLEKLDCSGTQMTELPTLPASLVRLHLVGTQIKEIVLPAFSKMKECSTCSYEELDDLKCKTDASYIMQKRCMVKNVLKAMPFSIRHKMFVFEMMS